MDGDSTPFLSQILEVERAVENLAKSGKLYFAKAPQAYSPHYRTPAPVPSSRYPNASYYAAQRTPGPLPSREYGAPRGASSMSFGSQSLNDYGGPSYYPPPPPLQQQYSHSQRQSAYPGPASGSSNSPYDVATALAYPNQGTDSFTSMSGQQYSSSAQDRFGNPSITQQQQTSRAFSPLGGSVPPLAPLSRLNTGSSHSTSYSSATPGMSSSMSMLPPGYGRDGYVPPAIGNAHSRAHSVTGSLAGLTSHHLLHHQSSSNHPRTHSISQLSESGRTLSGNTASSGTAPTTGIFSPPAGHSRTASISGSTNSPSPSAAAFNFFSGPPSTQVHGGSSMHSSITSANGTNASRIAPIGRPAHSKNTSLDNFGGSRKYSAATSGLTSPLGGAFADGWLNESVPSADRSSSVGTSSTINEGRKSVQSVWN